MQIYPAIDVQGGHVARGSASFPRDPLTCAKRFREAGAAWIHVVDLDRALGTGGDNDAVLRGIARVPGVRVQVGGRLRTMEDVRRAVSLGARRAVVAASVSPSALERLVHECGARRLAFGIDVREGGLLDDGGAHGSAVALAKVVEGARALGIRTVIYRNLERDGRLAGPDLEGAARLLSLCDEVILAGGVAGRQDILAARERGLAGVIVGRALVEGRFALEDAIAWAG